MKNTIWILFITCILITGCSIKKPTVKFEKIIGKKNSEELTDFLRNFENKILSANNNRGSVSEKYHEFASKCSEVGAAEAMPISNHSFAKFRKSQMWNEVYAQTDSIWINDWGGYNVNIIYNSEIGIQEIGSISAISKNKMLTDSLRNEIMNWQFWNHRGKYVQALEKVKNSNSFISEYLEVKDAVGNISNQVFCDMILRHNPNFNDYLVKRIIALELARLYAR